MLGFRLPAGLQIEPLNRIKGPWRWYYVDATGHCRRVRSPIVLIALALGWRHRRHVPPAVALGRRPAALEHESNDLATATDA